MSCCICLGSCCHTGSCVYCDRHVHIKDFKNFVYNPIPTIEDEFTILKADIRLLEQKNIKLQLLLDELTQKCNDLLDAMKEE